VRSVGARAGLDGESIVRDGDEPEEMPWWVTRCSLRPATCA